MRAITSNHETQGELSLTKALGEELRQEYPNARIFCNRCISRSPIFRNCWKETFGELCPPLQPEMDLIIWEPPVNGEKEKLRAIEIKWFWKGNGKVNQSFYKGIEQTLAMLQWGFDNVALWQLFDQSFSDQELWDYGGRTWLYVHNRLNLPIDYTMLTVDSQCNFTIVQMDWNNYPRVAWKMPLKEFPIKWRRKNPFRESATIEESSKHPLLKKFINEANFLRESLMKWLELPGH
ncbi:MAG: hypothetical protein NWE98_03425 [Candidatus Bathyarchaeota archaeon]|nr:hypothetical protein [Candidatus Bathyarchaeota archaeon]